jgi:methylmalonyl-CoA mutase N-terminal domain/subunit
MKTTPKTQRKEPGAEAKAYEERLRECKPRLGEYTTLSGAPVRPLYTPEDVAGLDYGRDLGWPGEYPYTRGVHPDMYRGRLWTMRQFSGFGTAKDTNQRYHYLLGRGQTGLSVAFDMPTLMGYDSDHERAQGEVGKCGVAISCLRNMKTLFDRIPLGKVSTSMTINGPAAIVWALYLATAESQGVAPAELRGTIQNDILKEYIAQKSFIFPPKPSMRLITDTMAFGAKNVPQWNPISISGYHIREAGSTALQELAFTLADGMAYVEAGMAAGLDVDAFAPRLSFFFDAHLDFFEEIAKFRAARRIWARKMREKFKAKDPHSWLLRFHTQTAGVSLTAQQPENNIVRTAFEALSAVLGGTQSLHTNSMDETHSLPTEKAVKIALRTQQVIAHEIGVTNTADPLAGSYFVEKATQDLEDGAEDYFRRIEELGGVLAAIEKGFFQREIHQSAYRYQRELEDKKKVLVGVNEFADEVEPEIEMLKIDPRVEEDQRRALAETRRQRSDAEFRRTLDALRKAARGTENMMPRLLDAVRAEATLGEIVQVLKEEFGEYHDPPIF